MERFNLICNCGHTSCSHKEWYQDMYVLGGGRVRELMGHSCSNCVYMYFKPDNLKYLEMLSKEKEVADLK